MNKYYNKWYDAMMSDPVAHEKYLQRKRERNKILYRKLKLQ